MCRSAYWLRGCCVGEVAPSGSSRPVATLFATAGAAKEPCLLLLSEDDARPSSNSEQYFSPAAARSIWPTEGSVRKSLLSIPSMH